MSNEELLNKAVYLEPNIKCYVRKDSKNFYNPFEKNMKHEFLWIIEGITKKKFNEDEWKGDFLCIEKNHCICCHNINKQYIIKHIPTNKSFLVGCACVKKVSDNLYYNLVKDKCLWCKKPILDKRKTRKREGYCSKDCYESSYLDTLDKCKWCKNPILDNKKNYGYCSMDCYDGSYLDFGKHEGKCITETPFKYINFVYNIQKELYEKKSNKFLLTKKQFDFIKNYINNFN